MNKKFTRDIKAMILGLIITLGSGYVLGAWSEPGCAPPNCNIDKPINIGSNSQAKAGPLSVGTPVLVPANYSFSAINGISYLQNIVSAGLMYVDGNQASGKVLTSDANGIASWKDAPSSALPATITVRDFSLLVHRNDNSASQSIPYIYQYCAISQLGADFANSDNSGSSCSVNRNVDGTWTLSGTRGDDPDFYCNARCFSASSKSASYVTTVF